MNALKGTRPIEKTKIMSMNYNASFNWKILLKCWAQLYSLTSTSRRFTRQARPMMSSLLAPSSFLFSRTVVRLIRYSMNGANFGLHIPQTNLELEKRTQENLQVETHKSFCVQNPVQKATGKLNQ
jgi:hypothetical protein